MQVSFLSLLGAASSPTDSNDSEVPFPQLEVWRYQASGKDDSGDDANSRDGPGNTVCIWTLGLRVNGVLKV